SCCCRWRSGVCSSAPGPALRVGGGPAFRRHSETLDFLAELGLPVNPEVRRLSALDEVDAYCHHWQDERHTLNYEIDGAVVKVDETGRASCREGLDSAS